MYAQTYTKKNTIFWKIDSIENKLEKIRAVFISFFLFFLLIWARLSSRTYRQFFGNEVRTVNWWKAIGTKHLLRSFTESIESERERESHKKENEKDQMLSSTYAATA